VLASDHIVIVPQMGLVFQSLPNGDWVNAHRAEVSSAQRTSYNCKRHAESS